jgi:MFS family permease
LLTTAVITLVRARSLRRRADVSDRAAALVLVGRFTDELLHGAIAVLTPTFRSTFGLSVVAISALDQVLAWVALPVEPVAALLSDVRSRRVLLSCGAAAVALAVVAAGLAQGFPALLVAFALYGLGSGPLAHTADVVVVEAFPDDVERAYARATALDTVGALLAPASVATALAVGVSWRAVLVGLGLGALAYSVALARTPFPPPSPATRADASGDGPHEQEAPDGSPAGGVRTLATNLRAAVTDRRARPWLLCLLWLDVMEATGVVRALWLADDVGLGQAGLAAYVVGEQVVALAALLWLDRRPPAPGGAGRLLALASAGIIGLHPLWLVAPGVAGRVLVGVPLAFLTALLWPVARARALASVPGRAGAMTAATTLFGALPLTLAAGAAATAFGLVPTLLSFTLVGAGGLLLAARATSAAGT